MHLFFLWRVTSERGRSKLIKNSFLDFIKFSLNISSNLCPPFRKARSLGYTSISSVTSAPICPFSVIFTNFLIRRPRNLNCRLLILNVFFAFIFYKISTLLTRLIHDILSMLVYDHIYLASSFFSTVDEMIKLSRPCWEYRYNIIQ